jgi:histone chaperone ASF1
MSVVSLLGVNVLNNPAKFTDKYEFEITFECLEELQKGHCENPVPCGAEAEI